jgi:DNA integrity scanning protein DisA with diadenylate cyclase activity
MQALACMPCAQFNFKMVDLLNPLATIQWKRRGTSSCGIISNVVQFKGKLIASAYSHIGTTRLMEADSNFSNWKKLELDPPPTARQ